MCQCGWSMGLTVNEMISIQLSLPSPSHRPLLHVCRAAGDRSVGSGGALMPAEQQPANTSLKAVRKRVCHFFCPIVFRPSNPIAVAIREDEKGLVFICLNRLQ